MAGLRLLHPAPARIGQGRGDHRQRSLADDLDDLGNVHVVEQPVAADQQGVARLERERAADLDSHFRGADDIGHKVAVLVVNRLLLVEQPRLDGVADRRVRDRQELDPAPLAGDKDRRVTDVVGPDRRAVDLDGRQGGPRPHAEIGDGPVGPLKAVQDRSSQTRIAVSGGHTADHRLHRQLGGSGAGPLATETVGDRQDRAAVGRGNDRRGIFVAGLPGWVPSREYGSLPTGDGDDLGAAHLTAPDDQRLLGAVGGHGREIIAGVSRPVHPVARTYDPPMPETAPQRSNTARSLVTARVTKRTREFPQLFPNPLRTDGLDSRDVALANAIDQAVARRWLTLVAVIQSGVSRPWDRLEAQVQGSLLVGAAQILLLDRIPDHAAINDAVDWIKSRRPKAAGMVNAVLRRVAELRKDTPGQNTPGVISRPPEITPGVFFARDELPLHDGRVVTLRKPVFDEDPLQRIAEQTSHPVELLERWIERDGFDRAARLAVHGLVHPPIILTGTDLGQALSATQAHCTPHEEPGFVVFDGDRTQLVPLLAGHTSRRVQDPASAAAVAATADLIPNLIVELCAGKGTQTRQLAEVHPQAIIIATDENPRKRAILREAFGGHDRVRIIDPDQLLAHAGQADLVVVDAPCSNTGVLARRVEARYRCTPETLSSLVDLQRQILVEALRLRATDGHILYCTCSVEPQENHEQVQWLRKWHRADARREVRLAPAGEPGGPPEGYRDGGYFAILRLP